jgi:hypothetical protein
MLPAIAESPGVMLLRGNMSTSKRIMLRKTCEMTTFPPMFLEGRHTATFMPGNKQSVIHQGLGMKQLLELKSF